MPDWTRRRALAALGTGAGVVGVGRYWYTTDGHCPDRREPDWTVDSRSWSPPVTDDYCTYVSESHGVTGRDAPHRIASLSSHDGSPNWVFTEVGAGGGVPLVADGTVYVGTGRDRVYALDQRTGHVEWRYDAGGKETYGGGAWGQPAKSGSRVLVGISHSDASDPHPRDSDAFINRVVALDADSGEEVWERSVEAMVWTGPVVVGDTVVAATEAGSVYGLAVGDGTERWRVEVGEKIRQTVFGDGEAVHVASEDGRVAALVPESGTERWTASVSGAVRATERDDETLFVGIDAGEVIALARSDGEERWRFDGDAAVADVSSDGSLTYVLDQRGLVHVLDASSGESRDLFRVAENAGQNVCGWVPRHQRGTGLVAGERALTVTGPWVGQIRRYRE